MHSREFSEAVQLESVTVNFDLFGLIEMHYN